MRYIIKTPYEDFEYDNGDEALSVAESLAKHSNEYAYMNMQVVDDKAEYHLKEAEQ